MRRESERFGEAGRFTGLWKEAHPRHVDPPLDEPPSLVGLQRRVAQAGGDHAVGHRVELGHCGSDGGGQVLLALLVALRPNAPQAVVRHHLLKQVLDTHGDTERQPEDPESGKKTEFKHARKLKLYILVHPNGG